MDWTPYVVNVAGWLGAVATLFIMLAKGKLHTDREFQNEKAASARLEAFYAVERTEDKATIATLTAALKLLAKSAEQREPVDELITKIMQTVQQQAVLRNIEEQEERNESRG